MKHTLKLMLFALLAFGMMACGEKKLTQEELQKAELTLVDDDGNLNEEAVPAVVDKFCTFVKQNPNDASAPEWLFKAFDISLRQNDIEKSEELCNKLVSEYPDSDKAPVALFMMAMNVYQVNDVDKAREMYERIIAIYPDSKWAADAKVMIDNYLGMTDEQIYNTIKNGQVKVEEEEVE